MERKFKKGGERVKHTRTNATIYRIAKWSETFETADSRRHKSLHWISIPIGFSSNGFAQLIDDFGDDAPAIYGAWIALVSIAATCPIRGILSTSSGGALTVGRLSFISHFPREIFEKLINWASQPEVNWIESVPPEEVQFLLTGCQSFGNQSPNELPDQTRPDLTLPNTTRPDLHQPVVGRSVGRVLEFSGTLDEIEASVAKFRKVSLCSRSTMPIQDMLPLVVFGLAVGDGFLSELGERLRSGAVRKPKTYCQSAIRKYCDEHGIDWTKTKEMLDVFSNEKFQEVRLQRNPDGAPVTR